MEQRGKKEYSTEDKDYLISELLGSVHSEDRMDEMLSILRKIAEQVVTKDDFLEKSKEILEHIAEQSYSEEELETKLNKVFMLKPNFFGVGIDLNELIDEIRKIKLRW